MVCNIIIPSAHQGIMYNHEDMVRAVALVKNLSGSEINRYPLFACRISKGYYPTNL